MEWGDAEGAKRILKEIAEGTELGLAIGNGAAGHRASTKHHRVPVVKGQAMPAWDPRPLKATGVTYCTSPMGADHTAGLIVNPGLPPKSSSPGPPRSRRWSTRSATRRASASSCSRPRRHPPSSTRRSTARRSRARRSGDIGWQCLQDEWEFNAGAGFTAEDDDLPECIREEPVGARRRLKFDVPAPR